MKTAKLIKENLPDYSSKANLYELSEEMKLHLSVKKGFIFSKYVVVSAAVAMFGGPETYIFLSDSEGKILQWCECEGSFKGELDHNQALENAGYDVI